MSPVELSPGKLGQPTYIESHIGERGRVTKSTYPVIGDADYFFDATGQITKVVDALDHSIEYFIDYTLDPMDKELKNYCDSAGRVTDENGATI